MDNKERSKVRMGHDPPGDTLHDLHGPRYAFSVKLQLVGVYFFYFFVLCSII